MLRSVRQMSFNFLDLPSGRVNREVDWRGESAVKMDSNDELTRICRGLLRKLGLPDLEGRVEVQWNARMRSCAGRAFWPQGLIQLNPRLEKISASEVKRTLLHELAHLIAYERYPNRGIKGHGREWQKACSDVGIPGESATHQLGLPTRKVRRQWKYECPACQKSFERVRRFKGTVACYECCANLCDGRYHDRFRLIEKRLIS